ncbi:hypothetical protein MT349_02995 [Rathayibacter caricis]|uniref:hypothetical protein n=1 Tax=Rathayibacter caricis TaxID=110936 RepID=UPI001FB2A17E|nr:hypothetical protein [Rathayibacter caricis]MCJ1694737.1 hypothetical protein [Rathayibacter caricis]
MTIDRDGLALLAQVAATLLVALVFTAHKLPERGEPYRLWAVILLWVRFVTGVILISATMTFTLYAALDLEWTASDEPVLWLVGAVTLVSFTFVLLDQVRVFLLPPGPHWT